MAPEARINIKGFRSLNLREPAPAINDNELARCVNFDIGRGGELKKRTGFEQLHAGLTLGANSVKLIGHFVTGSYSQIIARAGSNTYYSSDGVTWTLMGAYAVEFGVQYANKFYMVRKGTTILEWTGTGTPTAITGSPGGDFCVVHKERLFVFDSGASGTLNSRLYFSKPGDISATGWVSTNFFDFQPGDGDFLTCAAIVHDVLVVFKANTTWGLYVQGDSALDWVIRNLNPRLGCVSKYTPREIEGAIYFVSVRGVYRTDGTSFANISDAIETVLQNRVVNLTNANVDSAAWWEDKYIVLLQPDPSTVRYFVYHLRTQGWTEWEIAGSIRPTTFLEVRTAQPERGLYSGDLQGTGSVYRYGKNLYVDISTEYDSVIETKEYDFEIPGNMKKGKWIALDTVGSASISVVHITDGVSGTALSVASPSGHSALKLQGPGYFRTWQFRLTASGNTAFTFYGLTVYMARKRTVIKAVT